MAEIYLKKLAHSYLPNPQKPEDYALKEIDQVWEDGKAYALLGSSGCGKSTLLNIISGLLTPSQGQVLFDGKDVTHLPTEQRQIAQVFQFPVVYDTMSVYDNLAFPLRNRKQDSEEIIQRRMRDARNEIAHYFEYDYVIINDDFEDALADLVAIFRSERLRLKRQQLHHANLLAELVQ